MLRALGVLTLKTKLKLTGHPIQAQFITVEPCTLNMAHYSPLENIHEEKQAERKRLKAEASEASFEIRTTSPSFDPIPLPIDDISADKVAEHKVLIITDKDLNVIYGHRSVKKALDQKQEVLILKIMEEISELQVFLIKARYSSKAGELKAAAKMDSITSAIEDYGLTESQASLLFIGPKGEKTPVGEIRKEYKVGMLFRRNPGFKIPFSGFELDGKAYSNLKYLVGNKDILTSMEDSKESEEHFLRMAITASNTRAKRLNTTLPPLMKHPDTKELLFTEGITPAETLLKAKYPEEDHDIHPHKDAVSINKKLERPEVQQLLKKQLEKSTGRDNKTSKEIINLFLNSLALEPSFRNKLFKIQCIEYPEEFATVAQNYGASQADIIESYQTGG